MRALVTMRSAGAAGAAEVAGDVAWAASAAGAETSAAVRRRTARSVRAAGRGRDMRRGGGWSIGGRCQARRGTAPRRERAGRCGNRPAVLEYATAWARVHRRQVELRAGGTDRHYLTHQRDALAMIEL